MVIKVRPIQTNRHGYDFPFFNYLKVCFVSRNLLCVSHVSSKSFALLFPFLDKTQHPSQIPFDDKTALLIALSHRK